MKENKKEKLKGAVQDLTTTTLEVGTSLVLENLPEIGTEVAGIIGNEAVSAAIQTLTGGLIGGLAPAVLGMKLSYQQKRFERNILKMIKTVVQNQTIIEQRLNQLEPEIRQKFIDGSYRDVLFDHIVSENQEGKLVNNINGYINLMGIESPNDDVVFTFFETLSQMNELDIRVLKLYLPVFEEGEEQHETCLDIMKDENIDESQYNFIREKLCRLGMIYSRNEEDRDENLDTIGETLLELIKQLYSKKPKEVRAPKLKRIRRSDSYRITSLGRQYLLFIADPK